MGSDTAMYDVFMVLLLYPAYECVTCFFCGIIWMDVNMNTIMLRLHPTRVHQKMYVSSLVHGLIVLHAMKCARSSEYRRVRGLHAKTPSIQQFQTRGQEPRVTRMAPRQAAVSL